MPPAEEWENAKKPVPAGVHPLFLTMSTQEKFGCKEKEGLPHFAAAT